jgi:ABC transport system ATP-binding/permease protein
VERTEDFVTPARIALGASGQQPPSDMDAPALHVVVGGDAGRSFAVTGEVILGRQVPGPGQLGGDAEISRRHAQIRCRPDGQLVIQDLGSANGTYVNGERLGEARVLQNRDAIRVGHTELELRLGNVAAARARAPGAVAVATPAPPADAPPGEPPQRAVGPATLLHAGEQISLSAEGAVAGRAEDSAIRLDSDRASRHHARFGTARGGYFVADLGSTNGTHLNGERLVGESRWLSNGDTVTIGSEAIRFLVGEATQLGGQIPQTLVSGTRTIRFDGMCLTLGRDPANNVVLGDPNVSRFHAEVVAVGGGYELRDLGSRNGTRLDGQPIGERSAIQVGSEIGIGPFRLIFDGAAFVARDDRGALRLAAEQLVVDVKSKRILDNATVDVAPGEFVAIIGESGAGKTTLIKTLAGVSTPSSGTVMVNGEPVSSRLPEIGYVPQDEIVHRDLSVREALTYAARLRLPQDSSDDEIKAAVDDVLYELSLEEHAETRVASLSGGQRKRAGVGTELVNRPGLLFLDEATTGLDPGLERRMMEMMRDLANNSRAVITITHATKNLGMCDKVAVMGRGGLLCFFGAPADALKFFGVPDYDGIYEALEATPAPQWRERWQAQSARNGAVAVAGPPVTPVVARAKADRGVLPQAAILSERYVRLIVRDRRNLLILLGQVPILAILVAALFHSNVLQLGAPRQSGTATQLIFLLVTIVVWVGSIDAAREIIKERTVFLRERAVGVRTSSYLLSKTVVLFSLAAIQTLILCAIVLGIRHLDASAGTYVEVIVLLTATSWAAVGMGLALSAFVNTENQAMSFIPLALIPQLLFAGQIKPLVSLPVVLRGLAALVFSRWSFAGLGGTLHFYRRFALDPHGRGQIGNYGRSFFQTGFAPTLGIMVAFIVTFLILVGFGLRRRPA